MLHSTWLDDKYANLLSFRLDRFKRVGTNTYNFRCPICGDSTRNKYKARGFIFPSKENNTLIFKCHNCGAAMPFKKFLKEVEPELFKEYNFEAIKDSGKKSTFTPQIEKFSKRRIEKFKPFKGLKKISQLPVGHPVKKYIEKRQIPSEYHYKLYYVVRFMEWVNTVVPEKFNEMQLKQDEPRLVIPFIDEEGYAFGVTGRSFKKNSIRYLTIKFDEHADKIYGLDTVDKLKRVYVVEGPIDSFFINNSLAFAGSDGQIDTALEGCDYVIILDNQPRNTEIVKKLQKHIDNGTKVCIWPDAMSGLEDINDMILSGIKKEEIKTIIDKNTYTGLTAQLKLNEWKKV